MGGKGEGFSGTRIKGPWTKSKGSRNGGGVGMAGVGGSSEGKMGTTVLELQ